MAVENDFMAHMYTETSVQVFHWGRRRNLRTGFIIESPPESSLRLWDTSKEAAVTKAIGRRASPASRALPPGSPVLAGGASAQLSLGHRGHGRGGGSSGRRVADAGQD